MEWKRFLLAVLAAGFVSSITDWLFAGTLFHSKYNAHPEIWRSSVAKSETSAVIWSVTLGFLTCAAFVLTCAIFHINAYRGTLPFAALCWLMIPLPLLVTNALFIKLHPLIVVSHALGWLAKLCVAALAAALFAA